jgi:hypothetical protein
VFFVNRVINILTIASGVLCCLVVVLLPISYLTNLADYDSATNKMISPHSIPIASGARGVVYEGGIWLFTNDVPYLGSSRRMSAGDDSIHYPGGFASKSRDWIWDIGRYGILQDSYIGEKGELVELDRCGDLPGIYYRYFDCWDYPLPWLTVRVSLLYPLIIFLILPFIWSIRFLKRARHLHPNTAG